MEAEAEGDIASIREGGLEINWADMDGDGNAEVRIASKDQELGIGPSGNLWSWKVRGHDGDLVNRFDGGGACQDRFWWPESARASEDGRAEYELVTREIKGGRATVVFRHALSHWALGGLIIEKSYSVTNGPKFEVRVTVRNESPDVHEFSHWSHNCFSTGDTPTLKGGRYTLEWMYRKQKLLTGQMWTTQQTLSSTTTKIRNSIQERQ